MQRDAHRIMFEAARKIESVDGNLVRANQIYRQLSQNGEPTIAARALLRLAAGLEKLGDGSLLAQEVDAVQDTLRIRDLLRLHPLGPEPLRLDRVEHHPAVAHGAELVRQLPRAVRRGVVHDEHVHLGVAVSVPAALLVPVVREAELLSAAIFPGTTSEPLGEWVLFDHEEVGSQSDRGAASSMLPTLLERSVLARGGTTESLYRALARSACLSAAAPTASTSRSRTLTPISSGRRWLAI